jgi:hypothetical protein
MTLCYETQKTFFIRAIGKAADYQGNYYTMIFDETDLFIWVKLLDTIDILVR